MDAAVWVNWLEEEVWTLVQVWVEVAQRQQQHSLPRYSQEYVWTNICERLERDYAQRPLTEQEQQWVWDALEAAHYPTAKGV